MNIDFSRHGLAELTSAIHLLAHTLRQRHSESEGCTSPSSAVTKQDLQELRNTIMSQISDLAARINPKLERIQAGLDVVQELVTKLQNSVGAITPEDQALLDSIEAKVNAIASDADSTNPVPVA